MNMLDRVPAPRGLLVLLVFLTALTLPVEGVEGARPNVMFIAADDLNHWVGHLGRNPQAKTPNIDRLARMGVTFTRAYCAAPVCNPSRAALLSGRRPGVTGVYDNQNPYVRAIPASESLVMQFKNAGYETLGMGKLWHGGLGFPEQWSITNAGRLRPGNRLRAQARVEDRSIGPIKFGIVEGENIRPLLATPAAAWNKPAITTFGQNNHAVRTERWRYIRYHDGGEELYDHSTDPYEWTNLVTRPSELAPIVKDLARWLPTINHPPTRRARADGTEDEQP